MAFSIEHDATACNGSETACVHSKMAYNFMQFLQPATLHPWESVLATSLQESRSAGPTSKAPKQKRPDVRAANTPRSSERPQCDSKPGRFGCPRGVWHFQRARSDPQTEEGVQEDKPSPLKPPDFSETWKLALDAT